MNCIHCRTKEVLKRVLDKQHPDTRRGATQRRFSAASSSSFCSSSSGRTKRKHHPQQSAAAPAPPASSAQTSQYSYSCRTPAAHAPDRVAGNRRALPQTTGRAPAPWLHLTSVSVKRLRPTGTDDGQGRHLVEAVVGGCGQGHRSAARVATTSAGVAVFAEMRRRETGHQKEATQSCLSFVVVVVVVLICCGCWWLCRCVVVLVLCCCCCCFGHMLTKQSHVYGNTTARATD